MTTYTKYPRTPHFPWSPGATSDDKIIQTLDHFIGKNIVMTEKMDGENTTLYADHIHARSLDSKNHPSRSWVKRFWGTIRYRIPEGWRICGENLYAKHSIHYPDLLSYFLGFSAWTPEDECLSWNSTMDMFDLLGITPVPVLYTGLFDIEVIKKTWDNISVKREQLIEGYVVRCADTYLLSDFGINIAKYVRENHVQTDQHWSQAEIIPNKLRLVGGLV